MAGRLFITNVQNSALGLRIHSYTSEIIQDPVDWLGQAWVTFLVLPRGLGSRGFSYEASDRLGYTKPSAELGEGGGQGSRLAGRAHGGASGCSSRVKCGRSEGSQSFRRGTLGTRNETIWT